VSYRRTLVFLVIFVALATFFYIYEIRGGEARRRVEEQKGLLFSFKPEDARKLTLKKAMDTIVIEKQDAGWMITAPVTAPAEQGSVDRMLDSLVELKSERDIGAQGDLGPFGLAEPETEVEIAGGGGVLGSILLGTSTPDGSKLYVKLSEKEPVYTVSNSLRGGLDKTLFDLRDKKVVDFSIPDVTGVKLFRNGQTFVFEKSADGDWAMTSPAEHNADAGKVRRLLDSIRFARVKKFVEEDATDLAEFGLESPSALVKLEFADKTTSVAFGDRSGPDDSGNIYARRNEERQVLELGAVIMDNLSDDVDEWRDRTLLAFERSDVARLRILSTDGNITVERSTEDTEEWVLTEPETAAADRDEVQSLLSYLSSAKGARFLKGKDLETAERALKTPEAQLKLWRKDSEEPLTLSISQSDDQSEIYARTEPDGEIATVHRGLLDELTGDPDRLKDRAVLKFATPNIEKIEISIGERSFAVKREGVRWDMPRGLDLEDYELDRFLWDLHEVDYSAIVPRDDDDAAYGFDSPAMTIELWAAGADAPLRLVVGSRIAERNSYYVLGGDKERVMEIEEARVSDWLEKF